MKFKYQLVGSKGTTKLTLEELKSKVAITGYNNSEYNREELQGQPKILGFLGPMWNGYDEEGYAVIRYETQEVYNSYAN